ncbi:MAG: carbohydrate ABC transporter permease [Clostridia bacterium]|jgi:multiple sugar transport system permease protein|nr:carbohydrate ABC transporter permease [Clostridia bacterium]
MKTKKSVVAIANITAVVIIILLLFPLIMLILNAFRETGDIYSKPLGLPNKLFVGNFSYIFQQTQFTRIFINSFIIAIVTTLFGIIVTSLSGYAISRFNFKGKNLLLGWLLASQAFPGILLVIGIFTLYNKLGLYNSLIGLIILHTMATIPFSSSLMTSYFDSIPRELEEAALIDGCTQFKALRKVIFPLAIPGIIAVGTFTFLLSWNEFLFALVMMRESIKQTLPVFLNTSFVGTGGAVEWGSLSAAALLTALPPILIFLFAQRYLIGGLTKGAIK